MNRVWRINKVIDFGNNRATFMTLWEDARDVMCDSVRPDWVISDREKNRKIRIEGDDGTVTLNVSKEEGNALYREMVKMDNHGYGRAQGREWTKERIAERQEEIRKFWEESKGLLGEEC